GVQFKLDDAALGTEVPGPPHSILWTTTAAVNGPHTLTAVARDAAGNSTVSAGVSVTVSNGDVTPPVISSVSSSSVSTSGATITWTTDEPADSQVEYGTTSAYGSFTTLAPALVVSHSPPLSGLSSGPPYHSRAP